MRTTPIVRLLFALLACFSGTRDATSAETEAAAKTPDAAAVKKAMTPAQLALGDPITNSVGMVLVPIPSGEFQMGSPDSDKSARPNETPQHLVKITKPFYLSAFEVTQQQYEKVMGVGPWQRFNRSTAVPEGPDYPATYTSWKGAVEFCRKLSEQEGVEYRLPTEAQWEYACRAGTTTAYSFGDNASKLGQHAWYKKNTWDIGEKYPHRVGQKLPNSWGLYDMHGNVSELSQDYWYKLYDGATVEDPSGPLTGTSRAFRGSSYFSLSTQCRSAVRNGYGPSNRMNLIGFRVSRTYP